ncbi:MAG: trypsin-like peptidase domain-containing protein [Betaproteobacteria bacterium]|nr:trypsin-like peptidase domain-containing protein [Betaproteobacteria bacterium]
MRRLWLIFAQTATISLAALFVVATLKPELLPWRGSSVVTVQQAPTDSAAQNSGSYRMAAKKAMPSVVNVYTSKEVPAPRNPFMDDPVFRRYFGDRFDGEPQRASSLGSGVIVSPQGYILTNQHVVEAADEIEVALADGRKSSARIVGADPDTDLAVLKIELKNLPAITFGHAEQVQVGDGALAIGNPFGVGQTVTMGIISALGRSHLGINTFENFIQTDAAINPGNSGGALVDASGNLIGINSAIYSRSGGSLGIGFAIPASLAKQVMEQIIRYGSVVRGWIGVEVQDITPELAETFKLHKTGGVLIAGVLRNGPADRGGIKPGDLLLEINGKAVADSTDMLNQISGLTPNKVATIKIQRNQTEALLHLNIGKRPRQNN